MKKRITFTLCAFACVVAFADNTHGQRRDLPPGADPNGRGYGCLNNPGVGCGPRERTTPTPPPKLAGNLAQTGNLVQNASQEQNQDLHGMVYGSAHSSSGPASTRSGDISTRVGITQNVRGNTLKTGDALATGGNVGPVTVTSNPTIDARSSANGGAGGAVQFSDTSKTLAEGGTVDSSGNSDVDVRTNGGTATGNGSGNTLRNGDSSAQANGNGAGNTTTITDRSSVTHKRIDVPVLFNPLPPTVTVAGSIVTERLACGPLQRVVKTQVNGTQVGILSNTTIDLGNDYELAPVFDAQGNQVYYNEREFIEDGEKVVRRFGSQAIIVSALPNVSGASTFSIGFAGANGGANTGAGASSAMSRIVTKITMTDCELQAYKVVKVEKNTVSREDVISAITAMSNLRFAVTVPTQRVTQERKTCTVEEFTNAKGEKVKMCPGPNGSYGVNRATTDTLTIEGGFRGEGISMKK